MRIFDGHCDVLFKMFSDSDIVFQDDHRLQAHFNHIKTAGIKVQCFAIYVPERVHPELKFNAALHMADIFYEKVLKTSPHLKLIQTSDDFLELADNEVGAILTLEGCDAICGDIVKLKTLLRLGVSSVGLTWNHSNCVADGVMEDRGAGLTQYGKEVLMILNESKTWCDVSHLSERGFWDVMEWAEYPIASHSNCDAICPHPRNLNNEQLEALIERDSAVGLTFVSEFLTGKEQAAITDILRHLDHVCSLGGENHVGFGSDFDGIDRFVQNLEHAGNYENLVESLVKYYSSEQVEKFLFLNFMRRFP